MYKEKNMEIIVGIAVVAVIGYFVFGRKKEEAVVEAAPYKVETPEAKVEVVNAQPVAEEKPAQAKKAPAKKPAAPKAAKAKAPAKPKAAAKPKAPRKPKAPKA